MQNSIFRLRKMVGQKVSAQTLVAQLSAGKASKVVMLIGLPASGKSTISGAFEAAGWLRLNKDSLRKELYGDESILGSNREINALFYQRMEEAIATGRNILVDNTNVSPLHRKGPLALAAQHGGYELVTHVFLDVPLSECMRRNALRDRKVPEEAMRELAEALTWPGGVPVRKEGDLVVLKPGDAVGDFHLDRVRLCWRPDRFKTHSKTHQTKQQKKQVT